MKLFDKIFYYLSVPKCSHCKRRLDFEEHALCKSCREEYDNTLRRNCSICARPLYECDCTNVYLDSHYVHKLIKVFRYRISEEAAANSLLYRLKRDNRADVVDFLAEELASSIITSVKDPEKYIYTSVPRRRDATVKYGIDHAALLARATARKLGAKYQKLLISKAKAAQKKAKDRYERIQNANFKLRKKSNAVIGNNVIIIDDIVTTGASMGASAMLLKSAGAKRILGATLAIAYRDPYVPFDENDRFFKKK